MKEVKPTGLLEYLTSMRSQGYTVVGLEQTDSSQPLQSCALPARSILLLGKEKEGIPVDLLQVTYCVCVNVYVCVAVYVYRNVCPCVFTNAY
jgi:tRNA G18 (ribose-2'-O)-methylase SpoU